MSYAQAMKWGKRHRKGIPNNYLGFSSFSGFTPSGVFLVDFWEYVDACAAVGITPLGCEDYYKCRLRGGVMSMMDMEQRVERTGEMSVAA